MALLKLEHIGTLLEPIKVLKEKWANYSLYTALDRTQTNIERLNRKLSDLEDTLNALSPFAEGPRVVVKSFFLTADLTVPLPDEPNGTVLIYIFEQDSSGIHTVTFPADFIGMFPNAIGLAADSISSYAFLKTATGLKPVLTGLSGVEAIP